MNPIPENAAWHVLEERQRFSQSRLWEMQRHYFDQRGAAAWCEGEVPQYVTSSPTIGLAYANVVFAFHQDRQGLQAGTQPLTVCELGAGSGAFAFQFLRHLVTLCEHANVPTSAFRYVLTDFTQANLDAWRAHSHFQTWFDSGLLDVALFDIGDTDTLHLQVSGTSISTGQLAQPLVVLANYVFDGVPQELIFLKDGIVHDCLVSLATTVDPDTLDPSACIEHLHYHYDYQPRSAPFADAAMDALAVHYQRAATEGHVLLPSVALRALARLQALSTAGLFLLSADRGSHEQSKAASPAAPGMSVHGSFALSVNYHAFFHWCSAHGGLTMAPRGGHAFIDVVGLLLVDSPATHSATREAYRQHVAQFGPDDFYQMATAMQARMGEQALDALLDLLRVGQHDAHQLATMLPRLLELAPTLALDERDALRQAVHACWNGYFPLHEQRDLAFEIACLMQSLDDHSAALRYFNYSRQHYGPHDGNLFNTASCHAALGNMAQARRFLLQALRADPAHAQARALLDGLPPA